jgi:hypothetical protein
LARVGQVPAARRLGAAGRSPLRRTGTVTPFKIWNPGPSKERQVTTLASLEVITAFWAAYLGCRRAQLSQPATVVVRNGPGLADYHGATAFFRPPACVLAVPADWYEHTTARLAHQPAAAAFQATLLRRSSGLRSTGSSDPRGLATPTTATSGRQVPWERDG